MHWMRGIQVLFCTALMVAGVPVSALQPMADSELSGVTGQEGISIALELRLNTDANGSPLNADLTDCGGALAGFENSECRYALEFQGRPDEWLLFRGVYGIFKINDIRLDAGVLSQAGHGAGLFDATKFQDDTGACLISSCDNSTVQNLPSLRFEYPTPTTSYDPNASPRGTSSGYDSLQLGVTIKETLIVFGNDAFTSTATGSFLGMNIGDNNSAQAGIAISGRSFVYGF